MKSFLSTVLILTLATQEANSRLLRLHHGRGHGMMQGEGGGMMQGEGMMIGHGEGMMDAEDMMDEGMMMGDCQEMMEDGGMMGSGDMMGDGDTLDQCPMYTIHHLLDNRKDITRHIKDASNGVHTKTYSTNDTTNTWIRQHVESMIKLVHSGYRIRNCDGLFKELFDHAADLNVQCHHDDETGGVQCKFEADDDCAVGLAQAHARVISAFLRNGWDEMHQDHADMVPDSCFETSN
jgi:hypothetical protein